MGVQTPRAFGSAQDRQVPAHALSQQMPRTQCPVRHCPSLVQAPPLGARPVQTPRSHVDPLTQPAVAVQLVAQAAPWHR
jgi:hypothetical protein